MDKRLRVAVISMLFVLAPALVSADDVSGVDRILCSSVEATVCTLEDGCEIGSPWFWGIPQFIEIDLKAKRLSTTAASGESRTTPILSLDREGDEIFLQGVEQARAFSFVINKESGMVSVAVARDGITVSVFGACTPLTGK